MVLLILFEREMAKGEEGFRSEFGSDPELPTGAPLQDFAYIRCAMFIEAVHDA